jgi:cytidine deaminase
MDVEPLDADDEALVQAARDTLRRSYAPPRHKVAAAVRGGSGRVFVGVNVEACGYGPCAEPIAIGAAVTAGERSVVAVVAVHREGNEWPVLSPCGNCRQLVFDYWPDATVIFRLAGRTVKAKARELLPGAYESDFD